MVCKRSLAKTDSNVLTYPELFLPSARESSVASNGVSAMSVSLLWRALGKARALAVVLIAGFVAVALIYVLLRTPAYRAEATIGPVASTAGPSGATQAFAAYAGVDLGSGDTGRFSKYLQVLHSYRLAQRLEEHHHVLKYLVPGWDEQNRRWNPPSGIISSTSLFVKGLFGASAWQPPDAGTLANILSKKMRVERVAGATILDTKNQISTVTLELKDRTVALTVLGWIVDEADSIVREDQLLNTTDRINYLSTSLRKAPEVFLVDSLQRILLDQERVLMTLKADRRYSVDLIDPPNSDRRPVGLSAITLIVISAAMGVIVYVLVVLILLRRRLVRFAGDEVRALAEPFPHPVAWTKTRLAKMDTRGSNRERPV